MALAYLLYHSVDRSHSEGPAVIDADVKFPVKTARDWVSYGDHVVLLHLKDGSAREGAMTTKKNADGVGYIPRKGILSINKVLFSRAGAKDAPQQFTTGLAGWWVADGGRTEYSHGGRSRIENGHTYIAVLVWDQHKNSWSLTGAGGLLPFDGDRLGQGEFGGEYREALPDAIGGFAKRAAKWSSGQVAKFLQHCKPYPAAVEFANLPPAERAQRVAKRSQT